MRVSNIKFKCGAIGVKLGMSQVYGPKGEILPVTIIKLEKSRVLREESVADGTKNLVVCYGNKKSANKPMRGVLKKANIEGFFKYTASFRVAERNALPVGSEIDISHFYVGQAVDITGITKGKGFSGVVAKYGFGGLEASHGTSLSERAHGATGSRQDPGKVFKNKKMAGHRGHVRRTMQNLKIIDIDTELGLLVVHGSVPGPRKSYLKLREAVKRIK